MENTSCDDNRVGVSGADKGRRGGAGTDFKGRWRVDNVLVEKV